MPPKVIVYVSLSFLCRWSLNMMSPLQRSIVSLWLMNLLGEPPISLWLAKELKIVSFVASFFVFSYSRSNLDLSFICFFVFVISFSSRVFVLYLDIKVNGLLFAIYDLCKKKKTKKQQSRVHLVKMFERKRDMLKHTQPTPYLFHHGYHKKNLKKIHLLYRWFRFIRENNIFKENHFYLNFFVYKNCSKYTFIVFVSEKQILPFLSKTNYFKIKNLKN